MEDDLSAQHQPEVLPAGSSEVSSLVGPAQPPAKRLHTKCKFYLDGEENVLRFAEKFRRAAICEFKTVTQILHAFKAAQ